MSTTINASATNGVETHNITSVWSYYIDDPLAIEVLFPEQEVIWTFSLELFRDAFNSMGNRVYGEGDVRIEFLGEDVFIRLHGEEGSATLKFAADEIRQFLNEIDPEKLSELVGKAIEKWLETL